MTLLYVMEAAKALGGEDGDDEAVIARYERMIPLVQPAIAHSSHDCSTVVRVSEATLKAAPASRFRKKRRLDRARQAAVATDNEVAAHSGEWDAEEILGLCKAVDLAGGSIDDVDVDLAQFIVPTRDRNQIAAALQQFYPLYAAYSQRRLDRTLKMQEREVQPPLQIMPSTARILPTVEERLAALDAVLPVPEGERIIAENGGGGNILQRERAAQIDRALGWGDPDETSASASPPGSVGLDVARRAALDSVLGALDGDFGIPIT